MLNPEEKQKLQDALWINGRLNRDMLARDAGTLCSKAGLNRDELEGASFLMVEESGVGHDYPFSGEKLSPVLTVFSAADFEEAKHTALRLLNHEGKGTRLACIPRGKTEP